MIKLEPKFNWIPFDKNNPPTDLANDTNYLIFLREDNYDDGATWTYSVDFATPYGRYLDDFWDTDNDWKEGQRVEVLAYAEMPYMQHEEELVRPDEYIDVKEIQKDTIDKIYDILYKEYYNGFRGGLGSKQMQLDFIINGFFAKLKEIKND